MKSKNVNIKQLGIELQNTKSEKVFKQLFELMRPTVINYYKQYPGNSVEKVEDAYMTVMSYIYGRIEKYDVNKYSISTLIFLKVKQNLISLQKNYLKVSNSSDNFSTASGLENALLENGIDIVDDFYADFEKNDSSKNFWKSFKDLVGSSDTYDIFFDVVKNNLETEEICEKYNINPQIVANRVFNAKKKIKNNPQIFKQFIYED